MPNLGSIHSMSYLKPKHKWLGWLAWLLRYQDKDYLEQLSEGVTFFDLRIAFDKPDQIFIHPKLAQWPISYEDISVDDVLFNLNFASIARKKNNESPIVCKLTLEIANTDVGEVLFQNFIIDAEAKYPDIKFIGGGVRGKKYRIGSWLDEDYKSGGGVPKQPMLGLWSRLHRYTRKLYVNTKLYIIKSFI